MSKPAKFTLSFNLNLINDESIAMFTLYQRAFNSIKTYEGTPPDGDDIHIMMDIYGLEILIGPGAAIGKGLKAPIGCEICFTDVNEFSRAYSVLTKESKSYSLEGPFPWATKIGLVDNKFGVGRTFYYNKQYSRQMYIRFIMNFRCAAAFNVSVLSGGSPAYFSARCVCRATIRAVIPSIAFSHRSSSRQFFSSAANSLIIFLLCGMSIQTLEAERSV